MLENYQAILVIIVLFTLICGGCILFDKLNEYIELQKQRKIKKEYLIKISNLYRKYIQEKSKSQPTSIVLSGYMRWINYWIDKAEINNDKLKDEIKRCCYCVDLSVCIEKLKECKWDILED